MVLALKGQAYLKKGLMDQASKVSTFSHFCELSTILGFIEEVTREKLHPFADFTRASVVPSSSG